MIANECPAGLGWWVALLIGSIFGCVVAGLGLPVSRDPEQGAGRGWLAPLMFIPGTRECAVFSVPTGLVILAAGTDTVNVIMAGVLIAGMPLLWLGMRWFMADTERALRERRRAAARRPF